LCEGSGIWAPEAMIVVVVTHLDLSFGDDFAAFASLLSRWRFSCRSGGLETPGVLLRYFVFAAVRVCAIFFRSACESTREFVRWLVGACWEDTGLTSIGLFRHSSVPFF